MVSTSWVTRRRRRKPGEAKGPVQQMTQTWKDLVLAELAKRGKKIPWLAQQVGLSRSQGYKLFAKNEDGSMVQNGCAEVPQICDLLGVPPPLVEAQPQLHPKDARIAELLRDASDSLKDAVIEILSPRVKSSDDA